MSDPHDTNTNFVIAWNVLDRASQQTPLDLQAAQTHATLAIVEELARLADAVEQLADRTS